MNIADPVRWESEDKKQYHARLRESKRRAKLSGPYTYSAGSSKPPRVNRGTGQYPKFVKPRKPSEPGPKNMTGITFVGRNPRREWRFGEPMHVVKPVRGARRAGAPVKREETGSRA